MCPALKPLDKKGPIQEGPAVKKVPVFIGLAFALAATHEIGPEVAMTIESPVVACSR